MNTQYHFYQEVMQLGWDSSLIMGSALLGMCPSEQLLNSNAHIYAFLGIRECGSALYVGLARTAPPTNTNFRLAFLLTRLQEALYEDLAV